MHRLIAMLALLLLPAAAGAQSTPMPTMYKCLDGRGSTTYSNTPCDKQGLKANGTVTNDRVTSMPFTEPPKAMPTQKLKPPVEMPKEPEKTSQ